MKLTGKEKQLIANLALKLKSDFGAKRVILYGSAVRDELGEYSDIDILVVLEKVSWAIEKQIISICFDAELECGRVFSAVCISEDELTNSPLQESPLILNVLSQGKSL